MSRRYGHIGQAAQREAVQALDGAFLDAGGGHRIGYSLDPLKKGLALTDRRIWLLGQDSNLEPFG
jgi:hypothetical protein